MSVAYVYMHIYFYADDVIMYLSTHVDLHKLLTFAQTHNEHYNWFSWLFCDSFLSVKVKLLLARTTTAWMQPRPATWMTRVRNTARPTSAHAPVGSPPPRCATSASVTKPCGSSLTRCQPSTAMACFSVRVRLESTQPAQSADARPSFQHAPMRTRTNPIVCPCKPTARPTTFAGKSRISLRRRWIQGSGR